MGVVRVCLEKDSALEGLENVGIEDEDGLENEVADGVTAEDGLDICITTSRVIFPSLKVIILYHNPYCLVQEAILHHFYCIMCMLTIIMDVFRPQKFH